MKLNSTLNPDNLITFSEPFTGIAAPDCDAQTLQFMIQEGIIDIQSVHDLMKQRERESILQYHESNFKIWQSNDKYKRWKTHVYDESKKDKRRLIAKSSRKQLEDYLIQFYQKQKIDASISLEKIYPKWMRFKQTTTHSDATIKRINDDWNRFYKDSEIVRIPLQHLTKRQLTEWIHLTIKNNGKPLTKKCFQNMALIIRQCLDFAVEENIIEYNIFSDIKINQKLFRKQLKKPDENEVFLTNEVPQIMSLALKDFYRTGDSFYLAIPLNFYLGLRVGELVSLSESNISDNYLIIQQKEIKLYDSNDPTNLKQIGYAIEEQPKTDAGFRTLYMTSEAMEIMQMILNADRKSSYLFVNSDKHRVHIDAINGLLTRYCKQLGISVKRSHKIRKTTISSLLDAGININEVRKFAGHQKESTTLNCYCFNRNTNKEKQKKFEAALNMKLEV